MFIDRAASSRVRYNTGKKKMERVPGPDPARDQLQYGDIHAKLEQEFTAAVERTRTGGLIRLGGVTRLVRARPF